MEIIIDHIVVPAIFFLHKTNDIYSFKLIEYINAIQIR